MAKKTKAPGEKAPKKRISGASIKLALRELVWPRRWMLALGLLLILINRAAGLALPGSTKYLFDDVIGKHDLRLLYLLAGGVLVAVLLQAVTSYALTQLLSIEGQRLISDLRLKLQKHIVRLPVAWYDATKTGTVVSRIMNDVEGVRNLVGTGFVQLLGGFLTAGVALFLLFRINWQMTLVAFGGLTVFALVAVAAFRKIRPIFRQRSAITGEVTGRLSESVGGIRVVKGFHREADESKSFAAGVQRVFDNVRSTLTLNSLVAMVATFLIGAIGVVMMVLGAKHIFAGEMTVGDLVAYTLYLGLVTVPVVQMAAIGTQMTEAFAGLDRMQEVLAQVPEDDDPARVLAPAAVRGHVVFEGVSFSYAPGKPVLRGIDLEARPGTVTALVGSSGAGKSTLVSLVAAFNKPGSGRILVDGTDLSAVRLDSWRSRMAVVLQETFLFDGTIRENILFGRPDATEARMRAAAKTAHVTEFVDGFEKGFDTLIGERGVKLSGGPRQRVAIARAVLADPRILILDEATSSLDSESERYIQNGLAALMKGRTTFVIAHRLSTIMHADQILVMENGQIVERGHHAQLLRLKGRYHKLYNMQMKI